KGEVLTRVGKDDSYNVALTIDRRPAGVARVRRRVRLDRLRRDAADDPRRDGSVEPVGAAREQEHVARPRLGELRRRLPERSRSRRLTVCPNQREVVLRVPADDLARPRAAPALERDAVASLVLDDV